jgi:hypothetical protein
MNGEQVAKLAKRIDDLELGETLLFGVGGQVLPVLTIT